MTIALGILAADGIVIAADQQETSGSTKSVVDKVLSVVAKHGVIAVTGAGAAGHLDAMAQQVTKAFIECKPGQERKAIRQSFDTFYSKHIVPLYPFYERFPNCDIEAIIGVDTPRERYIWADHLTALWETGRYVVAGSGATEAALVLDPIFHSGSPIGARGAPGWICGLSRQGERRGLRKKH
jgi:20S proteasome alpha/beta subunit